MKIMIKADLSRAFKNWKFPLAVFLMFLVWELNSRRFGIQKDGLYLFVNVWGRSITYLMAVIITAIPFISAHIEEKENHFLRYSILRMGVSRYIASKLLVAFLSAFSVFTLATVLFLLRLGLVIPLVEENSITLENFAPMSCLGKLMVEHTGVMVLLQILLRGVQCGMMSILSMAFSTYIENSIGVFVIPFLLYYCFYFLLENYPMLCIERVYECITCYTKNPIIFFSYAFFVTLILGIAGVMVMHHKVKGEFQ